MVETNAIQNAIQNAIHPECHTVRMPYVWHSFKCGMAFVWHSACVWHSQCMAFCMAFCFQNVSEITNRYTHTMSIAHRHPVDSKKLTPPPKKGKLFSFQDVRLLQQCLMSTFDEPTKIKHLETISKEAKRVNLKTTKLRLSKYIKQFCNS